MKNDNFAEYAKQLEGMDRIELVLDLLVAKKITKDQAVVLIANDKQMKDKTVDYKDWYKSSIGTVTTTPYTYPSIGTITTKNPYIISSSDTNTTIAYTSDNGSTLT